MRRHTIELSERELRVVLSAFDMTKQEVGVYWWRSVCAPSEAYAQRLYERLRGHGA